MPSVRLRRAPDYGVAVGEADGDGEVVDFLVDDFSVVVDFLVVAVVSAVVSFFVVSFFIVVDDFLVVVVDFLVVAGAVVVVVVADSFLVVHEAMSPAASKTVME